MNPDKIVFYTCAAIAIAWGGFELGLAQPIEIKPCPTLEKKTVLSTTINLDKSQTCQYASNVGYGKAQKTVKIQ